MATVTLPKGNPRTKLLITIAVGLALPVILFGAVLVLTTIAKPEPVKAFVLNVLGKDPATWPFTGLVYRQALEHLHGVRDETETRALIVQENRRYSKRQLIWFKKEPNLHWIHAPGERQQTFDSVVGIIRTHNALSRT